MASILWRDKSEQWVDYSALGREPQKLIHPPGQQIYLRVKDLCCLHLLGPLYMRTFSDWAACCHLAWEELAAELALCGAVEAIPMTGFFGFFEGRSSLVSYSVLLIWSH